jgi:hypothetical protein
MMRKNCLYVKILVGFIGILLAGPIATLFFDQNTRLQVDSFELNQLSSFKDCSAIEVYGAPTGRWLSSFSLHMWIGLKRVDEEFFTIYEVRRQPPPNAPSPLCCWKGDPDRLWAGNQPKRYLHIEGAEADHLIPLIEQAIQSYPFQNYYLTWPGPNCNTFIAYIGRLVEGMHLELPPNAIGKDFLPLGQFFTHPPSGQGFQFSFFGLFGLTISSVEGIEINLFGLNFGFQPKDFAILLPGIGKITLSLFSKSRIYNNSNIKSNNI